jgi:hypothetical protein
VGLTRGSIFDIRDRERVCPSVRRTMSGLILGGPRSEPRQAFCVGRVNGRIVENMEFVLRGMEYRGRKTGAE